MPRMCISSNRSYKELGARCTRTGNDSFSHPRLSLVRPHLRGTTASFNALSNHLADNCLANSHPVHRRRNNAPRVTGSFATWIQPWRRHALEVLASLCASPAHRHYCPQSTTTPETIDCACHQLFICTQPLPAVARSTQIQPTDGAELLHKYRSATCVTAL
jgi:hypothetical protein